MGILSGALQGGVFLRRDGGFERRADLLPAGPEFRLAGTAEAVLRQIRGAEADEAQQLRLLLGGRRAAGRLQFLRQTDRGDVVACPRRPAWCQLAIAGEVEIAAARDWSRRFGRRWRRVVVVVILIGIVKIQGGGRRGMGPARQSGVVEQAEREGIVGHGGLLVVGGWALGSRAAPAA